MSSRTLFCWDDKTNTVECNTEQTYRRGWLVLQEAILYSENVKYIMCNERYFNNCVKNNLDVVYPRKRNDKQQKIGMLKNIEIWRDEYLGVDAEIFNDKYHTTIISLSEKHHYLKYFRTWPKIFVAPNIFSNQWKKFLDKKEKLIKIGT